MADTYMEDFALQTAKFRGGGKIAYNPGASSLAFVDRPVAGKKCNVYKIRVIGNGDCPITIKLIDYKLKRGKKKAFDYKYVEEQEWSLNLGSGLSQ